MNQTRIESIIEKITDTTTAFLISWAMYHFYIYPNVDSLSSFIVVTIFTIISFIRSYFWRRFFNRGLHRVVHNLVTKLIKG